jgi:hypothetical protein
MNIANTLLTCTFIHQLWEGYNSAVTINSSKVSLINRWMWDSYTSKLLVETYGNKDFSLLSFQLIIITTKINIYYGKSTQ